jgi:hypothetical protein
MLAAVLLAASAPAAGAQATAEPETRQRGPGALWDAYPLDQRPPTADGAGEAGAGPASRATGDRVAFTRQERAEAPGLAVLTAVCLAAGLALCAAGVLLGLRAGRRSQGGRPGVPGAWR